VDSCRGLSAPEFIVDRWILMKRLHLQIAEASIGGPKANSTRSSVFGCLKFGSVVRTLVSLVKLLETGMSRAGEG